MLSREDLFAAIKAKDWNALNIFLEQHFDEEQRPLAFALLTNDVEKVKLAYAQGNNISKLTHIRQIMSVVFQLDYVEAMRCLLEQDPELQKSVDEFLGQAANVGALKTVQYLLQERAAKADYHDEDLQYTAFLYAIDGNQLATAQWLVQEGYSKISESREHVNAVKLAVKSGDLDMLEWLYSQFNFLNNPDHLLRDTIMNCMEERAVPIARWLVTTKSANIHAEFYDKRTLLLHAALHHRLQMGMWLLSMGAIAAQQNLKHANALQIVFEEWDLKKNQPTPSFEGASEQAILNFGQALLEQGAGINTDFTKINLGLIEGLLCNPAYWVLIGAKINGTPFSYPGAINTIDELRDTISTSSIQQIAGLHKSVDYLLSLTPEDKNLTAIKSTLKSAVSLKQKCFLFFNQHPQSLPENYAEKIPMELAEEIKRFTQP